MGFQFKIAGEFLEVPAGTTLQLEQKNHLMQLGDTQQGEYSIPFSIPLTDINARLLGNPQLPSSQKNTSGIEAQLFYNNVPVSRGIIKVERNSGHFNFPLRGSLSVYYVYRLGEFWQKIKGKTLRNVAYGSPYNFVWQGFNTSGPNTGFIGHVTDVMNAVDPQVYDYTFAPVVNSIGFAGGQFSATDVIINCCAPIGAAIIPTRFTPDINSGNTKIYYNQFSPYPFHHFILKKIFETAGWNLTGTPLEDPDFKKSIFIHSGAIGYRLNAAVGSTVISWDFAKLLPKLGIGNYLISLANKFGWWLDYDDNTRTCTVRYRKDFLANRKKVDYTGKTSARFVNQISKGKVYRLEHAGAVEPIDFTVLTYQGELANQYALPAASTTIQNHVYLVRSENAFYGCLVDNANVAAWEKLSDNLANYLPDGSTDAISTNMQLPTTVFTAYRNTALTELSQKVVLPVISVDDGDSEAATFYTAFYHGVQSTINNVSASNFNFPYISATPYAPNGNKVGVFSLAWKFANGTGDEGIHVNFFKTFLDFIVQQEVVTASIEWKLQDILKYRNDQTILIRNSEYIINEIKPVFPIPELTEAELIRIV